MDKSLIMMLKKLEDTQQNLKINNIGCRRKQFRTISNPCIGARMQLKMFTIFWEKIYDIKHNNHAFRRKQLS